MLYDIYYSLSLFLFLHVLLYILVLVYNTNKDTLKIPESPDENTGNDTGPIGSPDGLISAGPQPNGD